MEDLNGIIAAAMATSPVRRRQARETLRSVFLVDGLVVKEFDIPASSRRYRRPWRTEMTALSRFGTDYCGAALGVVERVEGKTRKCFLVKRFIEGTPLETIANADLPDLARLMARIHMRGVITDDAHPDNLLRQPAGGLEFIDFGRAKTFPFRPAPAFAVGREFEKLYREGFGRDEAMFKDFLRAYWTASRTSRPRRLAIIVATRVAVILRALRKGRGR